MVQLAKYYIVQCVDLFDAALICCISQCNQTHKLELATNTSGLTVPYVATLEVKEHIVCNLRHCSD